MNPSSNTGDQLIYQTNENPRPQRRTTTAKRVRALVFFASDEDPRIQDLETINGPVRPSIPLVDVNCVLRAFPANSKILRSPSHIIYDDDEHVHHSEIGLLPDARLRHHWDEKAWEKRIMICLAKYHLLVTLEEGKAGNRWLGMVSGDMFLLKLSDAKGPNGLHFYEDIDPGDTKELQAQFCVERIAEMRNAMEARR